MRMLMIILVLFVSSASDALAQEPVVIPEVPAPRTNPFADRLAVKFGIGFDRIFDESTRPDDKDHRGSELRTHTTLPGAVAGEYFIGDDWLVSARWERGRHMHSSKSLAKFQSLTGHDREFEVRLERAFRGAWFYGRFDRLTVNTVFTETQPRYSPPRTPDGRRVIQEVIGTQEYEEKETTAYETFGGGVTYRNSGERVYYEVGAGLARVFGEYTRSSTIDGRPGSRAREGSSTLGLNYDGSVGFQVYESLGVEGSFRLQEYFGPDDELENLYTSRTGVRVYAVLRF